jgi:hypothetical protein
MPFPKITAVLLSETAAQMGGGKLVLTGFSGLLPNVTLYYDDPTAALQVTFVLAVEKGTAGSYDLLIQIKNDTTPGPMIALPMKAGIKAAAQSTLLGLAITGVFPGYGDYSFRVLDGGTEIHKSGFKLAPGPGPVL